VTEDETSASGRPALAETRDVDWERLVRHTHSLPFKRDQWGTERAVAWGRTQLRSLLALLGLDEDAPTTPERRQAIRGVRLYLTEGPLEVMMRRDYIGLRVRTDFLESAEALFLEPTLRAVFRRTPAPSQRPYEPKMGETDA
jgi:hypothetical protein